MKHHIAVDINGALREIKAGRADGLFLHDDGTTMTNQQAVRMLTEDQAKGYTVFAECNHRDATGRCLGHEN